MIDLKLFGGFDLAQCFYEKYGNPGEFPPIKNCVYVYSRTNYFKVGIGKLF